MKALESAESASSLRDQALSVQKRVQASSVISQLGKTASVSGAVQPLAASTRDNATASKVAGSSGATGAAAIQSAPQKPMSSVARAYGEQSAA